MVQFRSFQLQFVLWHIEKKQKVAFMVELVDTLVLGTSFARSESSSLSEGTQKNTVAYVLGYKRKELG